MQGWAELPANAGGVLQQSELAGDGDGLNPVAGVQFGQQHLGVAAHRVLSQMQFGRNLLGGTTERHHAQHLILPQRQRLVHAAFVAEPQRSYPRVDDKSWVNVDLTGHHAPQGVHQVAGVLQHHPHRTGVQAGSKRLAVVECGVNHDS